MSSTPIHTTSRRALAVLTAVVALAAGCSGDDTSGSASTTKARDGSTSSTTATQVMGDALAVALLKARGFTADDFALSHPGGALGRKLLLRVNDIMHTGDEIPHVKKTASLRDALLEVTRKNIGMTVICDDNMMIEGIFTDGDLRRVFDMGVDVRQLSIADVMTPGGIRVRPGILAVEALNLMQSRHITSVMVADGDHLLGVLHMHDLLRAGVV